MCVMRVRKYSQPELDKIQIFLFRKPIHETTRYVLNRKPQKGKHHKFLII